MSKFINRLECNFTQISNQIIQDNNISGAAFKLYCYIVSRIGNNPEWEFYNNDMEKYFKEGRRAFKNAKDELIEYGYIRKICQNKRGDGTFGACNYEIFSTPSNNLDSTAVDRYTVGGSTVDGTSVGGSTYKDIKLNNTIINKDITNKQKANKKENPDILRSQQEIEIFFQNKCNDSIDDNLEIINNDFSKEEIVLLAEFAVNRTKGKNNIKNTKTALKSSIYNRAVKIKASLAVSGIYFSEIFRKDEDSYIYLMKDGGSRVIDSLDQWIVDRVSKDMKSKQINTPKSRQNIYTPQAYTEEEMEEMMETQRKIHNKLNNNNSIF